MAAKNILKLLYDRIQTLNTICKLEKNRQPGPEPHDSQGGIGVVMNAMQHCHASPVLLGQNGDHPILHAADASYQMLKCMLRRWCVG